MSFPAFDAVRSHSALAHALRFGRKIARRIGPRGLNVSEPVCQLFLNGSGKQTTYMFTNFPSLYSPQTASACEYALTLFDRGGNVAARARVSVPAFASIAVRPQDVFNEPLPDVGILAARIRPGSWLSYGDKHLGTITSHFYAMYHDARMRSLSVVHPQTALWDDRPSPVAWRSNLIIVPALIDGLEIFQLNPTPRAVESTMSLCTLDGRPLLSERASIPPRSVRRILWNRKQIPTESHVVLAADTLAAPNAKPLLFQHYQGQFFSAAHT